MKNLKEYLIEKQSTAKEYDPKKAKTALEIETAMNNGDFIVSADCEFDCPRLSDVDLEDLEEAIKQYWDDGGINYLKLTRKGSKFKIETTKPKNDKPKKKEEKKPPVPEKPEGKDEKPEDKDKEK